MLGTRTRKILRDIWSRKVRTLLVATSIFIGVLGVVTLMTVGDLMISRLNEDYDVEAMPMLWVVTNVPDGAVLDNEAYFAELSQIEGLTDLEARSGYQVYWRENSDDVFIESVVRSSSENFGEIDLLPMEVFDGRYPQEGQQEFAIERRMADRYGLEVGDQVEFRVLSQASDASAIYTETWTVTGIIFHPYSEGEPYIYTYHSDAEYLGGFQGHEVFVVRFATFEQAEAQRETFVQTLSDISPYIVTYSAVENPSENALFVELQQWTDTLSFLGILAMIVSTFIVFNVVSAIMVEQRKQIGMMKSLGASWWDNFRIYAGVALTYGILGMVPGVLLGMYTGYLLTVEIAPLAGILIEEFDVAWTAVSVGVGMGIVVPLLSAILPIFLGSLVPIRVALTDLGIGGNYKRGIWGRLLDILPLSATMRQAFGNILQRKFRLAVTGFTLTLAIGSFMGVFALFYQMDKVIDDAYATFNYEIEVQPNQAQDFATVKSLIQTVDGIEHVYPGLDSGIRLTDVDPHSAIEPALDKGVYITGFDTTTDSIALDLLEGSAWENDPYRQGVVVTQSEAERLGVELGDVVYLTAENGQTQPFEIIGIDNFPFEATYMRWEQLAELVGYRRGAPIPNDYVLAVNIPEFEADDVIAYGLDQQLADVLPMQSGNYFSSDKASVIISNHLAEDGGYQVGDEIALSVAENSTSYPIVGIVEIDAVSSLLPLTPVNYQVTERFYVIGLDWQELATLEGRDLAGEAVPQEYVIQLTNDDASLADVDQTIGEIREVLLANGISADYYNAVADAEEDANTIMTIGLIFSIAAIVMAAVGAIGLLVALSMSVFERQREIGVMRSVGARSRTIVFQFLLEGLLVGGLAWLIGIPLSYGIANLLLGLIPIDFDFTYPLISLALGLFGTVLITTLASLGPSVLAARKTVSSILRYQ